MPEENHMNKIIKELKHNEEDFEFYPTTKEIIKTVYSDMMKNCDLSKTVNILDIGSGNGNFFNVLGSLVGSNKSNERLSINKYAIEKSKILIDKMNPDIFIIGTDFHQQSLLDKKMDVIFCNPPYSEYIEWAEKIIKESNSPLVYLVIPDRWSQYKRLLDVIELRDMEYTVIGSFDFLESEYRKARAKVNVVVLKSIYHNKRHRTIKDPFDIWFDSFFNIQTEEKTVEKKNKPETIKELVKGYNLIDRLEELYTSDMEKLFDNYMVIEKIDYEIFKELNIDIDNIKEALHTKITGLKDLYWKELFDNMKSITSRLTQKSRERMLSKLTANTSLDFTAENAYAIIMWAIKNANLYIDQQLKDTYLWMASKENVINYKSNNRIAENKWRYLDEDFTHYKLDYRLVFSGWRNFNETSWGDYDYPQGLFRNTHEKINDILVIASNLGFNSSEDSHSFEWKPGQKVEFKYKTGKVFLEVKAYKNGNLHCKFGRDLMKAINIEAARLFGWVHNKKETQKELELSEADVEKAFNRNFVFTKNINNLLLEDNRE